MKKREVKKLRHNKKELERALLGFDGLGLELVARLGQVDCCFTVSHLVAFALSKMGIEAHPVNCEVIFTNKEMRDYSPTTRQFKDKKEIDKFWKEAPDNAWSVGIGVDGGTRKVGTDGKVTENKEAHSLHTVIWLPETCEIIDLTAFQGTRNDKNLWIHPYWTSIFDLTLLKTPVHEEGEKLFLMDNEVVLPESYEISLGVEHDISPLVWFLPKKQTGKLWYKSFDSKDNGETSILLSACLIMISKATKQKCPSSKQIKKWADELLSIDEFMQINPDTITGLPEAMNQVLIMGGFPHLPIKAMGGETLNNINKIRSAYGMEAL
jgi:hypothetical protein